MSTGGESEVPFPGGMPSLTSDLLDIRPAVHVLRWPRGFPQAEIGGTHLHAAFHGFSGGRIKRTGDAPLYVAIDVHGSGQIYYGELILCFAPHTTPACCSCATSDGSTHRSCSFASGCDRPHSPSEILPDPSRRTGGPCSQGAAKMGIREGEARTTVL